MSELKRYLIVAGINGAGKSTLYRARPELFTHSKRLNADEILQKMGGDWHKDRDNFKAMREVIKQLHAALDTGQSIHVETTLAGQGKAQLIGFVSGSKRVGTVYQMKMLNLKIRNPINDSENKNDRPSY